MEAKGQGSKDENKKRIILSYMPIEVKEKEFILPADWQTALNSLDTRKKDLLLVSFCIQTDMKAEDLREADSLSIKCHLANMMELKGIEPIYK